MKLLLLALFTSSVLQIVACAQVFTFTREEMIQYTPANSFERFPDGRPRVPDALLERLRQCSSEELSPWMHTVGFENVFERGWRILHPGKKLIGRAVTLQYMPMRPDVNSVAEAAAKNRGEKGQSPHQRVIDKLERGDVLVVDLFGNLDAGGLVGDNLSTYINTTGAGLVVDGAIRDLEGISDIDLGLYFRDAVPAALHNVMLSGVNIPIRIGGTTVMPGDVVFGDREGVTFIPPQFVQQLLDRAEETHIHDEWSQMKLRTGTYSSSDIYSKPTDPVLMKEYEEYLKQHKKAQ